MSSCMHLSHLSVVFDLAARRLEIIRTTEQLLSFIDSGDYDNYLLVTRLALLAKPQLVLECRCQSLS